MSQAFTQDEIDRLWTQEDREDYQAWAEWAELVYLTEHPDEGQVDTKSELRGRFRSNP